MPAFLSVADIDQPASAYVARHGRVEREFAHLTQDSGNVSWIVEAPEEGRLFIKTAGTDGPYSTLQNIPGQITGKVSSHME